MTPENIISLFILYPIIILIFAIGFSIPKKKEPCGFWTGITPPTQDMISDIKSFNKKVGKLWITYATALLVSTFFPLFFEQKIFDYFFGFVLIIGFFVIGICYQIILKKFCEK